MFLLLLFSLLVLFIFLLFADTLGLDGQPCIVPCLGPGFLNAVPICWVDVFV